jgi:hypothetical protein
MHDYYNGFIGTFMQILSAFRFLLKDPVIYNNNLKESMHGLTVVQQDEGGSSRWCLMFSSSIGGVAIEICNVFL